MKVFEVNERGKIGAVRFIQDNTETWIIQVCALICRLFFRTSVRGSDRPLYANDPNDKVNRQKF